MSGYPSRQFSLCNPEGPEVTNLPRLLRRLANEIERADIASDDLLDVPSRTTSSRTMVSAGARPSTGL